MTRSLAVIARTMACHTPSTVPPMQLSGLGFAPLMHKFPRGEA